MNILGYVIKKGILAFIITSSFFLLFLLYFTPIYETDDLNFALILSGQYTKIPTPYIQIGPGLQTIHIWTSKLLVLLYTRYPHFQWYSFLLFILSYISLYVTIYAILTLIQNRKLCFFFIIGVFLLYIRILLVLSFTTISTITSMAGVSLFVISIRSDKRSRLLMVLSYFILTLGLILRQASFLLVVVLSIPYLLLHINKHLKQLLILSCVFLILFISLRYINIQAYKANIAWNKKLDFLMLLPKFFYNNQLYNYDANRGVFGKVGWSRNDLDMMQNLFYENTTIYNAQTIHFVEANIYQHQYWLRLPLLKSSINRLSSLMCFYVNDRLCCMNEISNDTLFFYETA